MQDIKKNTKDKISISEKSNILLNDMEKATVRFSKSIATAIHVSDNNLVFLQMQKQAILKEYKNVSACLRKWYSLLPQERNFEEDVFFEEPLLTMEKWNNGYHYILTELLPHRSNNEKYYYDKSLLYSGYRTGVEEFLMRETIPLFQGKIYLYFLNHVNHCNFPDVDNLDPKIFIDAAVNKIIVPDDNPNHIGYIMDSSVEPTLKTCYTEVFAGAKNSIYKFLAG